MPIASERRRPFTETSVAAARRLVCNRLGRNFEEKSSDAFCDALLPALRAGRESVTRRLLPRSAVIELRARPTAREMLRELLVSGRQPTAEELHVGAKGHPNVDAALRRWLVAAMKKAFEQRVSEISAEMERGATRAYGAPARMVQAREPAITPVRQLWLDQTLRVPMVLTSMAVVAEDPALALLDLPRRMKRESTSTFATIGLPGYRLRTDQNGNGVVIGVIDGEVNNRHPALAHVRQQLNLSGEDWGRPDPHGTAVAGIIGARHEEYRGIAPEATILNYKVFPTGNSEVNDDVYALALTAALEDGVDIVNCSWGVGDAVVDDTREVRACNDAWDAGVVVVKSAGNGGPGPRTLTNPAQADGVVVVGATDPAGTRLQPYSSRGPTTSGAARPHLVAPSGSEGVPLEVCRISNDVGIHPDAHGTSMAAPHVTAMLALLKQATAMEPDDLRTALVGYCTPLPNEDVNSQGAGLVSFDAFP